MIFCKMEHSRQILSLTGAAVNALSSVQDFHKDKKTKTIGGLPQGTYTPPRKRHVQDATQPVSAMNPPVTRANSATNDRAVDPVSGELQDQSSSSLLDLTFNGTQRVRVPSKLLREIKSPMERSSSSGNSRQTLQEMDIVDEHVVTRPSPVKVVRHVNGPSAWVELNSADHPSSHIPSDPVIREHSVNSNVNGVDSCRTKDGTLITEQAPQVTVRHLEDEAHAEKAYEGRKSIPTKGLYQGQPKSGVPIFNPAEENASDVKIKRFVLNDKEKSLKEQFLKRKDQRRPVKKLVQPTVVSQAGETNNPQSAVSSENPVATAAAIAAAAASAATGPFLQLQHTLEAQISALVNNLQVLQQNHNRQQELQDKEKEQKLQQQLEERLKRLEDLQAKMLETQSAPASYPTGMQQATAAVLPSNSIDSGMLPVSCTATVAAHHPAHVASSYCGVSGIARQDEFTQPPHSVAGRYHPQTTAEPSYQPRGHSSTPAFEKHKVVKNTKTQTSPQESFTSEDSPLQTPLPRKRPPVPISRYDLPRSRAKGSRSDVNTKAEKKARVRFEPGVSPSLLSYKKDMTHKGRGLLSELAFHDGVYRVEVPGKESRTLPASGDSLPPRPETAMLSSDVGKIKTDLKDILAETERLKQELTKQQLVKGNTDSGVLHVGPLGDGPSPLDEYLETTHKSHPLRKPVTSRPSGFLPSKSAHYLADAERLLQDVQYRRRNLDNNLQTLIRQREEHDLYNFVDNIPSSDGESDEMLRIRREVDKKIKEMNSAVQREIDLEDRGTLGQKQNSVPLKKQTCQPLKTTSSGTRRVEPKVTTRSTVTGNKPSGKSTGKENLPQKTSTRRGKSTKSQAPSKQSARVTPAQKEVYFSSVYGRQPHHPQRTTSKAPYLHYQSPVNPKTAAIMAGIMAGDSKLPGKPALQDMSFFPQGEFSEPSGQKADARKPELGSQGKPNKQKEDMQYYFHPRVDLSQVGEGVSRVGVPLEGQLVPMAIPLGKPKTDPALRPPVVTQQPQDTTQEEAKAESPLPDSNLSTDTSEAHSPVPTPVRPSRPAQPNVAVITVYGKELDENMDHQYKQHKKTSAKKKRNPLSVQVLPKVDIDSFSEVSSSSSSLPYATNIPEPFSRPDDSEYQEFRNFLAVTETGNQEKDDEQALDEADDDFHRIPTPQHPLTLEGFTEAQDGPYNGPPFPPVHPPVSVQQTGGVLEADTRQQAALEERAMEWIEQELLARIVSEMNQPVPDPTTLIRPQATPESSIVSETEDEDDDMLAAAIGQDGIQLFIDAGIPVDRELVTNLIREVIAENVSTILGHPKPRASPRPSRQPIAEEGHPSRTPSPRGTPLPTPAPTPEYTPPESEESVHESAVVVTPERSPTPSVTSEEPIPSESAEEEKDVESIKEEMEKKEQSSEQISEIKTPVTTPVPTPPAVHSPLVSISTPEASVQELGESQDTIVPTPPPSVVVKTPTPEPEPEPGPSMVEEPNEPKEPAVSQKELTPPQPAKHSVSSPSSMSSTTLGATTITTEEEMSEGELIQPYAHVGMYSEGEFALSPTIVQLAAEKKLPMGEDWDSTRLGHDDDSRNELVRVALNGILKGGPADKRHRQGSSDNSSRSNSESEEQISGVSTLRDTEDIREDSITDVSRSEGELPHDPMVVLLSRIKHHMRSAESSMASEGELLGDRSRMPRSNQKKSGTTHVGVVASGNLSPGEVVGESPDVSRDLHRELDNANKRQYPTLPVNEVVRTTEELRTIADGELSVDDRSLHASDLLPGTLGAADALPFTQLQRSHPRVIQVEEHESEPSNSQRTYSVEERREDGSALLRENESNEQADVHGLEMGSARNSDVEAKETEPQKPTKIQVTLPSIDDVTHEESSIPSDAHVSIDQDTIGDVSSISGGDF